MLWSWMGWLLIFAVMNNDAVAVEVASLVTVFLQICPSLGLFEGQEVLFALFCFFP